MAEALLSGGASRPVPPPLPPSGSHRTHQRASLRAHRDVILPALRMRIDLYLGLHPGDLQQ